MSISDGGVFVPEGDGYAPVGEPVMASRTQPTHQPAAPQRAVIDKSTLYRAIMQGLVTHGYGDVPAQQMHDTVEAITATVMEEL